VPNAAKPKVEGVRWFVQAGAALIAGAIASVWISGFIALFAGLVLVGVTGDLVGGSVDGDIWLVSLVLGPLLVAGCTFGTSSVTFRRLSPDHRRRSTLTLACLAGGAAVIFLLANPNGSLGFLNRPWCIAAYLIGVGVPTRLSLGVRRERPS
jgi:hypothetical protein